LKPSFSITQTADQKTKPFFTAEGAEKTLYTTLTQPSPMRERDSFESKEFLVALLRGFLSHSPPFTFPSFARRG
jgi:hypothetical protein